MTHLFERMLWLGAAVAIAAAAMEGASSARPRGASAMQPSTVVPEIRRVDEDSITRGAAFSIDNDPFRLSRRPSSVRYSSTPAAAPPSPVATAPRPTLVLRGIVGGPPWSAIVEGIPGREGTTLLRPGDSAGTLVVRSVGRDTVVIKGADTTWRLTVKRTW